RRTTSTASSASPGSGSCSTSASDTRSWGCGCGRRIRGSVSASRSATTPTRWSARSGLRSPRPPCPASRSAARAATCSSGPRRSCRSTTASAPRWPRCGWSSGTPMPRRSMPDPPARDEDLVRLYLSRDQAAFAALVERPERRVYSLALRMTGREEDARDAAQDTFLTVLRKLSSFRGEAAFTTWLHRVTVNACYALLRKRQRAPMLERGEDDLPAFEPPPAPDHADASSLSMDVQRALLQVPEDFRAVMIRHDVHDLRQEEVAAIVGVPIGTVKSRLHRGRIALARAMGIERPERVSEDPEGPPASGGSPDAAPGAPRSGGRAGAGGAAEGG